MFWKYSAGYHTFILLLIELFGKLKTTIRLKSCHSNKFYLFLSFKIQKVHFTADPRGGQLRERRALLPGN